MSYYGVIFPEFWTGTTGRQLRVTGGKDAQLLGLYLATNRHANMLGLYHLLPDDIRHETGMQLRAIARGFDVVAAESFAQFDAATSYVWVRQMARIRLGLKAGESLAPEDKRVVALNRIYHAIEANPFLGEFYDLNRGILRLRGRRESIGLVVGINGHHHMSGLPSPLEAPSKPGTEIRYRDQVQESGVQVRGKDPKR